jgi:hypothetical protein
MAAGTGPDPSAARVVPWRGLAAILGAWALLLGPVFALYGPADGGVTLVVGLMPAFAGQVLGQRRPADLAALVLALLVALGALLGEARPGLALAGAGLLILAAALEAGRTGGRAFVLALYGWCALMLSPTLPAAAEALPFVVIGLLWGALSARLIGVAGLVVVPPVPPKIAASLGLFLAVGVLVSAQLSHWLDPTYGYWVVLLFVLRALSPPHQSTRQALRYGLGAVAGSGCAFMLALTNPPGEVAAVLALALILVGLRLLPHPAPWSPAAFTSAVLLLVPVGTSGILVRLEATLIAVALTVVLVAAIGVGWRLIDRAGRSSPAIESRD